MSRDTWRAAARVAAPSISALAIMFIGLTLGSYWQYVIAISLGAMVIGAALSMLVGYARCITLATGAMMAIGAYTAAITTLQFEVPFLVALSLATVAGGIAGIVLAVPGVRFRGHNLAMVTLVFQAVVIIVLRESRSITGGAEGMAFPPVSIFGVSFSGDAASLVVCGVLFALALLPLAILLQGALGKNLRAVASNEHAARAFGINVEHHLIAAFAWSSAAIAFAGAVSAPRFRIIDPDSFGVITSIFSLAYPILGGMGSIWGGLIGGGVLRIVPEILRPLADYLELVFCVLVVVTLIFLPNGLASIITDRPRRRPQEKPMDSSSGAQSTQNYDAASAVAAAPASTALPASSASDLILEIDDVTKSYGALRAVGGVSLKVPANSLYGLMGPNGAGKTTLFNIISGFIQPDAGQVKLDSTSIEGMPVEARIGLGMTRTFQHASVFHRLSCIDNVLIGLGANGIWQSTARSFAEGVNAQSTRREREAALAALDAVGLAARWQDQSGALSLGDQRRLEVARAIVSRPRIILLDEPVSGVAIEEVNQIGELLRRINREFGIAMVVIEHNIGFLASLCTQIAVMGEGKIIIAGEPSMVVNDRQVRLAYFGEVEAAE